MKRLVLCGGGHAHVEVLRRIGRTPLADTEVVLASPGRWTPYSGMLPGLVAGHYTFEAAHIDLERLTRVAGVRFVPAAASSFDPDARAVRLDDGTALEFDLASLDVGSTPAVAGVPGAADHAITVKPVARFLEAWTSLLEASRAGRLGSVAVVGGGAAGVEMTLAMQHRLRSEAGGGRVRWTLVTDADVLLPAAAAKAARIFARVLAGRGVEVRLRSPAARVTPGAVVLADGGEVAADAIVWATGAAPLPLLRASGLALDAAGFVAIDDRLRSVSHPHVLAAGDCATLVEHPRPKSGVFAVRQGPPLAANLRAALAGSTLVRHVPQSRALALVSTGDKCAVATRGAWAIQGAWVWRWKDWIDRRFMRRYR